MESRSSPDLTALADLAAAEADERFTSQMMALIEGSQRQQTGITGDLPIGRIGGDGWMTVEGEAQLW